MTAITDIKISLSDSPQFICSVWTPKHGWVCEDTDVCTDDNPHGFWTWANLLETAVTGNGDFWLDDIEAVSVSCFHKGSFTNATADFIKEASEVWAGRQDGTATDDLKVPEWMDEELAADISRNEWAEYRAHEAHIRSERRA